MVERPGPGIALVADEGLRRSPARAVAHRRTTRTTSPSSGGVLREAVFGQIAAHLGFGMRARRRRGGKLEHRRVADDQRAVGLLGRQPVHSAHPVVAPQRCFVRVDRLEADLAAGRSISGASRAARSRCRAAKVGEREGVGQQADARAAPHARQRELAAASAAGRLVFPGDAERQQPALGVGRRSRFRSPPAARLAIAARQRRQMRCCAARSVWSFAANQRRLAR